MTNSEKDKFTEIFSSLVNLTTANRDSIAQLAELLKSIDDRLKRLEGRRVDFIGNN